MVSLSTAYGLCSLIDQQGFLHVSEDQSDCALVTLGRNIVIRYRLADQKQLNSWSTVPQLTSKVVYHAAKQDYIGIFNENLIKLWKQEDANLDKVSKIKLKASGHEVLLDNEAAVVLFKSGACCQLSYVADRNHEPLVGFLPEESKILSARIMSHENEKYLLILGLIAEKHAICYSVALKGAKLIPELSTLKSLKLKRKGNQLLGSCFVLRENGYCLVTLWSDGFMYALPLPLTLQPSDGKGQFVGVMRTVSTAGPVALAALSPHHLAAYGGDPSEEGAVVAVFNLDFGMVQAATNFKLLQKPPRVWAINGRLLVGLGQRLVCVPYSLQTGSVAALVGTRPVGMDAQAKDVMAVMPSVSWEKATPVAGGAPKSVPAKPATGIAATLLADIDSLAAQGCSEARICETMMSQLVEKNEVEKLCWCLDHFVDIPERLTVRLLRFGSSAPDVCFPHGNDPPISNGNHKSKKRKRKVGTSRSHVNGFHPTFVDEEVSGENPVSPLGRAVFLDRILRVPANRAALVPALRSGLPIADCITLLQYITYLLSAGKAELETPTIDWATTIIDAFYQQLVLGRHSECVESVLALKAKVEEKISTLNELNDLLPVVLRLKNKKSALKNPIQSKSYSIQKFQLYQ